jgi:hypothetical protein
MAIEYATYMQDIHNMWLDGVKNGAAVDSGGIAASMVTAIAANPYSAMTGYDPATDVTAMASAVTALAAVVATMNPHTDYDTYHQAAVAEIDATVAPDTYINARTQAHAAGLDSELNMKVIPRFNAGMRDINAVQTSAFVIGRAIIETERNDKVDKFMADMRYAADAKRGDLIQGATNEMIRMHLQQVELSRVVAAITIEELRLSIAAKSDYQTELKAIAADKGRWPLEVYKYGANMLASIGGGTTSQFLWMGIRLQG